MGILRTLFPKLDLEEEFLCGICKNVLEDPFILRPCEHTVCKSCIDSSVPTTTTTLDQTLRPRVPKCPVVGCRLQIHSRNKAPRVFTSLLNKLDLNCPFDAEQCEWQDQLGELDAHRQACAYNPKFPKACGGGCGAKLTRDDQDNHSCVAYLKEKLNTTEEKLKTTEEKLKTTEGKLKKTEEKLEKSRNRSGRRGPDASSDDKGSSSRNGKSVATGGSTQSGIYRPYRCPVNSNSVPTAALIPNTRGPGEPIKKAEKRAATDGVISIKKSNRPKVAKKSFSLL